MYQYIHLAIDLRTKYYHDCALNVKSKLQRRTARRVKKKHTKKYKKIQKKIQKPKMMLLHKAEENYRQHQDWF